ncbi:hypothetical protein ADILRU_0987 [Leifsonia rubra CMS 76R]|nr:hypothetical protein ADILRU_0987 [Leifsonia rubra CMS 76R]
MGRRLAEGKRHNQALLALTRRRCNVLCTMTRDGHIKIRVGKAIDIRKLDMLIANVVLAAS